MAIGFRRTLSSEHRQTCCLFPKDGNDNADLDNAEILLTGWGIDDRHETINSLHWGPDGWLYGLQGIFTHSIVGKPKPGIKRFYTHNDPFPENLEDLLDGEGERINGVSGVITPPKTGLRLLHMGSVTHGVLIMMPKDNFLPLPV
jgi:hypothetical protein